MYSRLLWWTAIDMLAALMRSARSAPYSEEALRHALLERLAVSMIVAQQPLSNPFDTKCRDVIVHVCVDRESRKFFSHAGRVPPGARN